VQSVFIGGGTPSLFSSASIEQLLNGIRARIALKPGAEITLEANPGTVDQEHFSGYREAGVNRLSIGVQSLSDMHLRELGRIHNSRQAISAVEAARKAGFDSCNLDLMFGLPQQNRQQAMDDLQAVIELQPQHLSWYQLTLEPNTFFYHNPPQLPDDDAGTDMQFAGREMLEKNGYLQYEVSAWSQPGKQCRHNLNYWYFGDYLGIGAGAHAKISDAATQKVRRTSRKRHPGEYLKQAGTDSCIAEIRELSDADILFEFALNRLRLKQPFTVAEFERVSGLPAKHLDKPLDAAIQQGLLIHSNGQIQHTEQGWLFLNDLIERFLPPGTSC
jgi:oxygen-independent coproporphyrinogen-3 oxidase